MSGTVSSSAYISAIARRVVRRAWWLPAFSLTVIAVGLGSNIRIAILGLMLLFIIYPMIMSFTIMRYAALPSLAERTLANRFALIDGHLHISSVETEEESGQENVRHLGTFDICGVTHSGSYIIFSVGKGVADIIIARAEDVDPSALSDIESRLDDCNFIAHDD